MTFGEKLQKLRKEKGWTQEQLAAQISISRQALSKWELGTAVPDTENVIQISKLFQVSTDYLLKDEYESDIISSLADTPEKKSGSAGGNKIRVIAGLCVSGVSLLGLLIIGILSSVRPANYIVSPAGADWVRVYTGLTGFLKTYNLEWLAILLTIMLAGGAAAVFYPKIRILNQKLGKLFKKQRKSRRDS